MAALVETMMSVRETPWHGLGTIIDDAPTSKDAIRLAGLDWSVESKPVFYDGNEIPNYKANVRSSDNSVLGIVTDRYQIVQNSDAFEFTDSLIGDGEITYETAGSLRNGKQIWLLAKMPTIKMVGDDVDPYICFTNSHDGTGAIKVCMTDTRVVCNNTLNIALSTAKRMWSTKHMGDLKSKLIEAQMTLQMANEYNKELALEAEKMADQKLYEADIDHILSEIFPIDTNKDSARKIKNMEEMKDAFYVCYAMPDIAQFKGTKWGALNAMADMTTHMSPTRKTENYRENNWGRIINGHPMLDQMMSLLSKKAA